MPHFSMKTNEESDTENFILYIKYMVTIYDNTLNPVVTKTSHFQLGIKNF